MKKCIDLKKIAIVLATMLLLVTGFSMNAKAESLPTPRWTYIADIGGGIIGSSPANVGGNVTLHGTSNKAAMTATLQKYNGGWENVTSWYAEGYGTVEASGSYTMTRGTYRIRLYVAVYSPSGKLLESTTVYTGEQSFRN